MYKKIFNFIFCIYFLSAINCSLFALDKQKKIYFKDIVDKAKNLAKNPYEDVKNNIPDFLKNINYDEWRNIRFKPNKSFGGRNPFKIQLFHLGFIYQKPVFINYLKDDKLHNIKFSTDIFEYKNKQYLNQLKDDIGFAGFRIHYPLNTPLYDDELIAFLGASYFRALGKKLRYGISARGLAVNTVEDIGEEFPYFKEFFIVYPEKLSKEIIIYALLDSMSLSGAYEFIVSPGEETTVHVKSIIFIRNDVKKLGIAPLTSMYFYGESSELMKRNDFRPEVHDSDGFFIHNRTNEWVWHPLINAEKLVVNSFLGDNPIGFGLMQRDINFDHYQDLEARYDLRPSVWVSPESDFGEGHLELIQIPTDNEYNDNIVAYFVPNKSFKAGDSLSYSYNLYWHSAKYKRSKLGTADSTRLFRKENEVIFLVDFLLDSGQKNIFEKDITSEISEFNGYRIIESQIIKNEVTGGYRLVIKIHIGKEGFLGGILPSDLPPIELRASLKSKNIPVTETWSYTYLP